MYEFKYGGQRKSLEERKVESKWRYKIFCDPPNRISNDLNGPWSNL